MGRQLCTSTHPGPYLPPLPPHYPTQQRQHPQSHPLRPTQSPFPTSSISSTIHLTVTASASSARASTRSIWSPSDKIKHALQPLPVPHPPAPEPRQNPYALHPPQYQNTVSSCPHHTKPPNPSYTPSFHLALIIMNRHLYGGDKGPARPVAITEAFVLCRDVKGRADGLFC